MNKIINGKELAQTLRDNLKNNILIENMQVTLAVILVGNDPASSIYVKAKEKACNEVGIVSKIYKLDDRTTTDELLDTIDKLNNNKEISGILVQLPLPQHVDTNLIVNSISANKDVDGFTPYNTGLLVQNNKDSLKPCTPSGVLQLIKSVKNDLTGLNAVIIGRSNIVGLPCAHLLLQENCTVTITHSKTKNLQEICKSADILIVAIGKAQFIDASYIKDNAIIIDVGINRIENKLVGDVNFEEAINMASYITPVPGGVGPMTIANLLNNTILAYKLQNK